MPKRILCIQLKQLGDVLMTTASVRALAQAFPDCEIDFLTQKPADQVYINSPYVEQVYSVKWKAGELIPLLTSIRRRQYDLLIDFSGSSKTAGFSWFTRIKKRIGFSSKNRSRYFTDKVVIKNTDAYNASQKAELLSCLNINNVDPALDFYVAENADSMFRQKFPQLVAAKRPVFAISPISKREYKVWPADRFAKICDRIVEQFNGQIFFLIGPGESHFAEAVERHMQHECLPIDDSLSLQEAACLLDHACCYVGNDNGLMHLSVARKRPTFGIFGRPMAKHWTSPVDWHMSIEFDPGCKSNCYYPGCQMECLSGISIDQVWRELNDFISAAVAEN